MNIELQQQQHQQQQQQQQFHQLPLLSSSAGSATTTTATTSEYANINVCDGTPLLPGPQPPPPMATSSSNASLSNASFVTLSMLSTPLQPQHTNTTAISPTATSTFKTPLLPMPSLEDIEGSLLLAAPQAQEQEQMLTSQLQQQMHPQPIPMSMPMPMPIPGGILKYPPPPAITNTITVGIPLGLGPGPPPQPSSQAIALLSSEQQALPSPPLTLPPTTLALSETVGLGSVSGGILRNSVTMPPTLNTGAGSGGGGVGVGVGVASTGSSNKTSNLVSGGIAASSNNLRQKPGATTTTARRKCCCACFGGNQSNGGTTHGKKSTKKHKRKTKTLWSALLTNLGICALLLAYTLLGSFIFLTIESEDSTLLQRTLASTKRVGVSGSGSGGGLSGRGTRTKSSSGTSTGSNHNNVYHNRDQQQLTHQHLDNGTLMAAAATSSLSSYPPLAASSASASSSSSYSSSAVLEGIVPLSNVALGRGGDASGGHNDFTYASDNDVDDDDIIAADGGAGVGDDATSQLALSADTYDVRQRTIENIWDITVSLNILYKENWTKLAAAEIAKFQDQLIKRLNEDTLLQLSHDIDDGNGAAAGVVVGGNSPATEAVLLHTHHLLHPRHGTHEWNFAKAFLYSLTVLTTIGYGNIAPRTTLGRLVTLAYAVFGIPLTLVYLSSTGGILAKVAREVFSKALCCCLCSNCGYCCYDERRMAEKERRMKRKRQQEELRKQQAATQEPYYVRSGSMTESNFHTPEKQPSTPATVQLPDIDSLSASESRGSMHGLSILAPILLCLTMMVIYIVFGAVVLYRLEEWPLLDGIYFCFMSLSTIGFGDMLPALRRESTTTTWFCSIYIMSGMALTAMCFNVIHEEIVHRIRIVVEFQQANGVLDTTSDEQSIGGGGGGGSNASGYYMAS